ncbi:hypothetical protein M407DRAFT_244933 [Tulasnella calospora MUT 4182]|uniref:Uncharacterized protein n=1 Tax=Tulasnella calospora MUT 4182 TaxID=1051891 RepID=A0A0C3QDX5_9AGAM|nr:hypothetical protein M407DRAFT_244933 [Tulasnella calospora MUT 4182]
MCRRDRMRGPWAEENDEQPLTRWLANCPVARLASTEPVVLRGLRMSRSHAAL